MDEYNGFSEIDLKRAITPEIFNLILFPTEDCNFRCVYCYEDFSIGTMPDWVVNATKELLNNKVPKIKMLQLNWFGGEPLMAKKTLLDISQHAYDLCQENQCGISGHLTTNAFNLDVKTLTQLVNLKQNRFQISLDGAKEHHDTTRLTRNGRGSFDKIWKRITDALSTDLKFHFQLRVHLTALNVDKIQEFCEFYEKEVAGDPRVSLFFKCIEDLGGEDNKDSLSKLGAGELRQIATELQNKYQPPTSNSNYICYASKPNSLAIRANGNIGKCTVALSDDTNHLGKINPDGSIEINQQKFSTWVKGFSTLDKWQLGCPHSYITAQKKQKKSSSGDIDIVQVA